MNSLTKFKEVLGTVATLAFSFVCICLSVVLLHANKTLTAFDKVANNVEITRKSLDDLMMQTTVLIVDADTAATKETATLDDINKKITTTLGTLNQTVVALTVNQNEITLHTVQTLDATTDSIKGLQPVLNSATGVLNSATTTVDLLHSVVATNAPVIGQTADNVQAITKQSVDLTKQATDTLQHLSGTTGEVQQAVHSYLHPTWVHKAWNAVTNTGLSVLKFFI